MATQGLNRDLANRNMCSINSAVQGKDMKMYVSLVNLLVK